MHTRSDNFRSNPQRSYAVVLSGLVSQLLLQLGLQQLLAYRYGSSLDMDAYLHAANLPLSLSTLLTGILGPVVITVVGQRSMDDARRFAGLLTLLMVALTVLMAAGGLLLSLPLMSSVNPGFEGVKLQETANLFRILVWLAPLNVLIGILQSVLNAKGNFLLPALAGVAGPGCTLLLIGLVPRRDVSIIAYAVVLGALVNVLLQLHWSLRHMACSAQGVSPHFRTLWRMGLPLLGGMLFLRLDLIVDKYVLSLLKIDGASSQQNYTWQILSGSLMVTSGALSTVTFPRIAARVHDGPDELGREVVHALGMLVLLCVPVLAALSSFAEPLVHDVYERGAFTAVDTVSVSRLLQLYAPMLLGAAVCEQNSKTLLALGKSITPNLILAVCISAGCLAKLILVPTRDVNTLATITSATWLLAGTAQFVVVAKRVGLYRFNPIGKFAAVSIAGTLLAMAGGWGLLQTAIPYSAIAGLFCGAAIYLSVVSILGRSFILYTSHVEN